MHIRLKPHLKERYHFRYLGTDGRKLLKQIFKKQEGRVWLGFIWLKTEFSGMLLSTFGFHKSYGFSRSAEQLPGFQEGFNSVQFTG
jgi:hypothetical protein